MRIPCRAAVVSHLACALVGSIACAGSLWVLLRAAAGEMPEGPRWTAMPADITREFARVVPRLSRAPFEALGTDPAQGGIRRLSTDGPRDTIVAFYPAPMAEAATVTWTREERTEGGCDRGQARLALWAFTARRGAPSPLGRATPATVWAAGKLEACLAHGHAAPRASEFLPVSVTDPGVRARAVAILKRFTE